MLWTEDLVTQIVKVKYLQMTAYIMMSGINLAQSESNVVSSVFSVHQFQL